MTNTVGVLLFVLLFVVLAAADASVLIRTPLWTETKKNGALFEIRGDRVIHIDTDAASEAFFASCNRGERAVWTTCCARCEGCIRSALAPTTTRPGSSVPCSGFSVFGTGVRHQDTGTEARRLKSVDSEFQRVLATLNPDEDYVAFVVRPDGIEAFRAARDIATKRSLQTGWEPATHERELIFGSGGRVLGIQ